MFKTVALSRPAPGRGLPPILLARPDHDRLQRLAEAPAHAGTAAAELLEQELLRARVVEPDRLPADVVAMGRSLEFVDLMRDIRHTVTLVWPAEADVLHGRISVMTPVGAALIGLKVGASMRWRTPGGQDRALTVTRVVSEG